MSLPPPEKLCKMSDAELQGVLDSELKTLFESVSPERRKRLEAMQWKVDMIKNNAPNKYSAMIEIYKLMLEKVGDLGDVLNGRERIVSEGKVVALKA